MPLRLTLSSRPTSWAWSAETVSDEAMGSLVNSMFFHEACSTLSVIPLPVRLVMPWLTRRWASAGLVLTSSLAWTWPSISRRTASGWSLRNLVRTTSWVVTNLPSGHSVRSSSRTLPPPSWTRRVAQGSGTQAPSIWPERNVSRVWALSWGTIETSPPPSRSALRLLLFSQERRATSWVPPRWGDASFLPLRSAGPLIGGLAPRRGPPGVGPGRVGAGAPVGWAEAVV